MTQKYTILFDLDGTLIDSARSIVFALNDVFADAGFGPVDVDAVKPLLAGDAMKLVRTLIAEQHRKISDDENSVLTKRFLETYMPELIPLFRSTWLKKSDTI